MALMPLRTLSKCFPRFLVELQAMSSINLPASFGSSFTVGSPSPSVLASVSLLALRGFAFFLAGVSSSSASAEGSSAIFLQRMSATRTYQPCAYAVSPCSRLCRSAFPRHWCLLHYLPSCCRWLLLGTPQACCARWSTGREHICWSSCLRARRLWASRSSNVISYVPRRGRRGPRVV